MLTTTKDATKDVLVFYSNHKTWVTFPTNLLLHVYMKG